MTIVVDTGTLLAVANHGRAAAAADAKLARGV